MLDYQSIKKIAAEHNLSVKDLLALSPSNDPFYAGTPADVKAATWFAEIWRRTGYTGNHLRRVHYWAISQRTPILMPPDKDGNARKYENTEPCWDYLVAASKKARYLGMVRIEHIIDAKHPTPHIHADYDLILDKPSFNIHSPKLEQPTIWIHGIENAAAQPYHLEIWCEKSTMNDVLLPLAEPFGVNVVTFEGEVSITACYNLMKRIEASGAKPARIWYISDFDPAGNSMPVAMSRKVEYMLAKFGRKYDVKIKPALLTAAQVSEYDLPRTPIKESEKRAARFEASFGSGAVELDAMEALYPGELADIMREEIEQYYDQDAADQVEEQREQLESEIRAKIEQITARYTDAIAGVQGMLEEIRAVRVDASVYHVEQAAPNVIEDSDDWLFDTKRGYVDQIMAYKAHKAGTSQAE
jgi:hypothetical protein